MGHFTRETCQHARCQGLLQPVEDFLYLNIAGELIQRVKKKDKPNLILKKYFKAILILK